MLDRVFHLDMTTCPFCRRGSLRIIAAITHESVITRILRHCNLASVPPPIAPPRCRQELFVFDSTYDSWRGPIGDVRPAAAYLIPLRLEIPFEIPPPSLPQPAVPRPLQPAVPRPLHRETLRLQRTPC
jgi:hypothetical protein